MNLKEISDKLLKDSNGTSSRGLGAIAEAEKYLRQAYEGRYFFELIQNVRDSNKEIDQDGDVFIELKNNILSISNTGAAFSEKGIEGITTIGRSTKHSQDYIGFKGIGFKSIQEVTDRPAITTSYGSIYFDRKLTLENYNDPTLKEEDIPLFYFPHFKNEKLSNEEVNKGIVTKIVLPLKKEITQERIIADFSKIQSKQLILLGNIRNLIFKTEQQVLALSIRKEPQNHLIVVEEHNKLSKFKYYNPKNKIQIPEEIIDSLEGKEKEIFANSSSIDVTVVLELTENEQLNPVDDAKLFLFYPLNITSGFKFLIHSYFVVNPERTALRESKLNDFLLSAIGQFIGKEMLIDLKRAKINTNKVLYFKRNEDAKIDTLYDTVVGELKDQKFIYDNQTKRYFNPSEVIIADNFDKGLFPDNVLGNKKLIYIDDDEIISWLCNEFDTSYLGYEDIADQIESECKRQSKLRKLKFFQNLYNYARIHEKLNLTGKKVLLTDDWKLVSSEEDVFYGGGRRNPLDLPKSVKRKIHFIHKGIKISDFREGKSRTGIIEFNTYEFVRRLLKLFNDSSIPNADLLNVLYNIQQLDVKSELEIKEKILLPVKGSNKWLSPINHPIYFENENLRRLYPNGCFVNDSIINGNEDLKLEFLKKYGVWNIPAVYIPENWIIINSKENRYSLLSSISSFSSRPFYIYNDRALDIPNEYDAWFTEIILTNWMNYKEFIQNDLLPRLQYSSNQSYLRNVDKEKTIILSHFIEHLSKEKWICFKGEDEKYSISEVVGITEHDYGQTHNQVIRKFLKLLPIDFLANRGFIEAVRLIHLDAHSVQNFEQLLTLIFNKYEHEIPEGKDFVDFYNRMLGKLVDFVEAISMPIDSLQRINFLSVNDTTKTPQWKKATQIFYIDDKPAYDILPLEIKQKVQPHFTNRDKNTFGKIAGKIGQRFSRSIRKELLDIIPVKTSSLISFFGFLPESIALLESHLGDSTTKHIERIKSVRVLEKNDLKIKISVAESPEIIISVNHFVDSDLNIHINTFGNSLSKNKQISDFINELFLNLLERDLRNFNANLLNFLNATNKRDYLKNYDIADERVDEIRNKLNDSDLSSNQKFWIAILQLKGIKYEHILFKEDRVDIVYLSRILNIEPSILEDFEDHFDFFQTSNKTNVPVLFKLLNSLMLTLEQLNEIIFPKIDFRNFYSKELAIVKNSFERGFNAILYQYLTKKNNDEKSNYQRYLDKYKYDFHITIPLNILELNAEEFFLKSLLVEFPFLQIDSNDLQTDFSSFNPNVTYSKSFDLLKNKLVSNEKNSEKLDFYLSNNSINRSLLYFGEVDSVLQSFRKWLEESLKSELPINNRENIEDFLNKFSLGSEKNPNIERVQINSISIPASSGKNGGGSNGKRYDGSNYDEQKQRIGLVAELVVFEKLNSIYKNVMWVSKNASKVHNTHLGYNPEGYDGLGYDIEYTDSEGNKCFVEVKGRFDGSDSFEISSHEIEKAKMEGEFYKIILVSHTMDNNRRTISDLGNIFLYEDGEDLFSNSKFTFMYKSIEIRFQRR